MRDLCQHGTKNNSRNCFRFFGSHSTSSVGRENNIPSDPEGKNCDESILYHSLKPKCFDTNVLERLDIIIFLFKLQLRNYARVT